MIDPFTRRRIARYVEDFRNKTGALPTLQDFEKAGFPEESIKAALKEKVIEKFYVTLTNGTIVKGYKLVQHCLILFFACTLLSCATHRSRCRPGSKWKPIQAATASFPVSNSFGNSK